jgi:hypothetical protein
MGEGNIVEVRVDYRVVRINGLDEGFDYLVDEPQHIIWIRRDLPESLQAAAVAEAVRLIRGC